MTVAARDVTLIGVESIEPAAGEAAGELRMDEDAFRAFYERTARPLWAYVARAAGDAHAADDLVQEAFYRLLRAHVSFESDEHRRHYLYRIATNLVRDARRRRRTSDLFRARARVADDQAAPGSGADRSDTRTDLRRALAALRPRERELLWLAYAEGVTHEAIAAALGLRPGGIKVLLFRARRKLARLLRAEQARCSGGAGSAQD